MSRVSAERRDPQRYSSRVEIPVLAGDLGPQQVVSSVALGRFFEQGRLDANVPMRRLARPLNLLVAGIVSDYLAPVSIGAALLVGTGWGRVGRTSLQMIQAAWQRERLVATCDTILVLVDDDGPSQIPESMRNRLAAIRLGADGVSGGELAAAESQAVTVWRNGRHHGGGNGLR